MVDKNVNLILEDIVDLGLSADLDIGCKSESVLYSV